MADGYWPFLLKKGLILWAFGYNFVSFFLHVLTNLIKSSERKKDPICSGSFYYGFFSDLREKDIFSGC